MKGSDEISSTSPPAAPTDSLPPSPPTARRFALAGPTAALDPAFNAYRGDVADIALAGRVIASHYAEPLVRTIAEPTRLLAEPAGDVLALLDAGVRFAVLDCGRGLAWGYAVADHRVGYIDLAALS